MRKSFFNHKLIKNDKGSTLVTVIVAISFILILLSILLSTTVYNIKVKGIDRGAKDSFYYSDKAINDIYTKIGQNVQKITANSYELALASVGGSTKVDLDGDGTEETYDFKKSEEATKYYRAKFLDEVTKWINDNRDTFASFIVDKSKGYSVSVGNAVVEEDSVSLTKHIRIPNLQVTTTDTAGTFQSTIVTDIVVYIPAMNFFDTNADIIEYAIIANDGIEIDGSIKIKGNLYAGTNSRSGYEDKSGIELRKGTAEIDGDYVISKGNVDVGNGTTGGERAVLKVGKNSTIKPNFWFDSLRTVKESNTPQIDVNANLYALNDLELNANGSEVSISGNYYGYDDGTLASASLFDTSKAHSTSSAILINGNNSSLTMLDVSNFVLLGKAYIDPKVAGADETETAEAVALKTNQQLYLVPPDFLNKPNPLVKTGSAPYFVEDDLEIPDTWFGTRYLKNVRTVTVSNPDGTTRDKTICDIKEVIVGDVVYAFLNFNDEEFCSVVDSSGNETGEIILSSDSAPSGYTKSKPFTSRTAYIKQIMSGTDTTTAAPAASELRKRIKLSIENRNTGAFSLENCIILQDGSRTYDDSNIYAKNSVVSYYDKDSDPNKTDFEIVAIPNTAALDRYTSYPGNLFHRFKWLCADLKNWNEKSLSENVITPEVDQSGNDTEYKDFWDVDSDYPFCKYVKIPTSGTEASKANFVLLSGDSVLASDVEGFIICDGDLTVKNGVKVSGTIIASGTITFEGNNEVATNRGAIQKLISEEIKTVKKTGAYADDFLISYLIDGNGALLYNISKIEEDSRVKPADEISKYKYNDYMFFDRWQKGGR